MGRTTSTFVYSIRVERGSRELELVYILLIFSIGNVTVIVVFLKTEIQIPLLLYYSKQGGETVKDFKTTGREPRRDPKEEQTNH